MPRFLIADDHALFRGGLMQILLRLDADAQFLEAGTAAEALAHAQSDSAIDLVLLDLALPDQSGIAALKALVAAWPTLPVVVLSANDDPRAMQAAFEAGALGYIPKATPAEVTLQAIRLVMAGGIYTPPEMLRAALPEGESAGNALTPSQARVLKAIVEGKSNKIIAHELGLSEATVKAHLTAIYKALGVANRLQAARAALREGIV